jgi:hypothetical protein
LEGVRKLMQDMENRKSEKKDFSEFKQKVTSSID